MSFLYPLMWLAALGIGVPLWLHLRRKEETGVVHFSAMRFLDDQPLARSKPMWPRDWLLLLLRMLILLLIVAAFSWPYLISHRENPIRESRVYLLDNTLSHQAEDRFPTARDRVAADISAAAPDVQIAVVELKNQPEVIAGWGDDRSAAEHSVLARQPSHARGTYLSAFRAAKELLQQALGDTKRIVFVGDSQQNAWQDGLQSPPFLDGVTVELGDVEAEPLDNLSVSEPAARRVYLGGRVLARCSVRLNRFGNIPAAKVVFYADGREVHEEEVAFAEDADSAILLAEFESDPSRWLRGEVGVTEPHDVLPADDRVYFSLPPIREGRAAVIADSTYLKAALSPEIMRGRWQCSFFAADALSGELPVSQAEVDALCVESAFLVSQPVRDLVLDCLNAGKGVMLVVGRGSPVAAGFLREFGIETSADSRASGTEAEFRYVFLEHPIFQPFRSPDFGSLLDLRVNRFRRLQVAGAMPLAFSKNGEPLLFESASGKGKLLVFAFAMDRSETNWPLHPTFVPFLDKCLNYLRPAGEPAELMYQPGESCVWTVAGDPAADPAGDRVTVSPVDPESPVAAISAEVVDGLAKFLMPDRPGHYELRYGEGEEAVSIVSVNPPPEESDLRFTGSPEALAAWQTSDGRQEMPGPSTNHDTDLELSTGEIQRQKIWWWLVVAATVGVMAETLWISRTAISRASSRS